MLKKTENRKAAEGTYLQGSIRSSFAALVARFGEPNCGGDGEKVQAEWILVAEDGSVATIYDWKETVSITEVTEWNVGGHDEDSAAVREVLR